ncbi:hypothetical protein D3C83_43110 [compost metagenome]
MPGGARIERVGGQRLAPADQREAIGRHDEVQVSRFAADRAVALGHPDFRRRQHFEPHPPAVTTARVLDHESSLKLSACIDVLLKRVLKRIHQRLKFESC